MGRIVAWFSHGAASAVATKMVVDEFDGDVLIHCIDTGSEHPDNERFRSDCEAWFEHKIVVLRSDQYVDIWDVFDQTGYLVGPAGARCTTELKKKVRWARELPDDVNVFGYTADPRDAKRAERFVAQNPGVAVRYPLIEAGLTKSDCLALVERAGIELPVMYRLGYSNNNCLGCVKGGMGYWNKIRVDFPDVFDRMARQERKMGRTVLRSNGEPVWLDELDPTRGNYHAEDISCGPICEVVAVDITPRRSN